MTDNTVPMTRGTQTANVHPNEVKNYEAGGWSVAQVKKPKARARQAPAKKAAPKAD